MEHPYYDPTITTYQNHVAYYGVSCQQYTMTWKFIILQTTTEMWQTNNTYNKLI